MRRRTAAAQRYQNCAGAGAGWALKQKSTAGAGLKFRLSQKRRAELRRAPARGNWIQSPDRWTLNATALTNCRRNSKPLHPTDASRSAARLRERGALPRLSAGRSNDTLAGERRWSRGDRSRAAVRPPFSPPGSAADFPSRPAAPSADQAAPAAAASDWRLPETASRARHRVARRGRVSRCTS